MYSEKQKHIFKGVLSLAAQGKDMRSIKVQTIAEAAGVGKGTLYEYFSTKEEILLSTLAYSLEMETDRAETLMEMDCPFAEKLQKMQEFVLELKQISGNVYRMLMDGVVGLNLECEQMTQPIFEQLERGQQGMDALIAEGRAQGAIAPEHDDAYCHYVLTNTILSALGMIPKHLSDEKILQYSVQMALKALA